MLDTNIISEIFKTHPHSSVLAWFQTVPSEELYLSVLSIGEIRKGAERLSDLAKKQKIIYWLEHDLLKWFEERILSIDAHVADKWGFMFAQSPKQIPAIESLIAATALTYNLKLVTRNVADFQISGIEVINPWETE